MSSAAWTHTMAYDDVSQMIGLAQTGMSVIEWRTAAIATSRLLHGDHRLTQLRIAAAILRPVEGAIVDDLFLTDLRAADDAARRDLIDGRYLASTPLAVTAARELFVPAVRKGRTTIERAEVEAVVTASLPASSAATIKRSRTSLGTEFARAGVVRVARNGPLELTGNRPAPLAIYHLICDELRERREASDAWLATSSVAAALFALSAYVVREYLELLVQHGRLQRSYYGGEPRILAA